MRLLEKDADAQGFDTVFVDMQSALSPEDAIRSLATAAQRSLGLNGLWAHFKSRLGDLVSGEPEDEVLAQAILKADWKKLLDALLSAFSERDRPTLILIDELSVCLSACVNADRVDNGQRGHELLYSLRKARASHSSVRWFITGSIGIDHIAEQHALSGALNDLHAFELGPLDKRQATLFVNHLCSERQLEHPSHANHAHLQQRLGWLAPHYIENLLDHIEESDDDDVNESTIDAAIAQLLVSPWNRLFSDWPDHLTRNYDDDSAAVAHHVLQLLAQHEDGEEFQTLKAKLAADERILTQTLQYLCNDGYLVRNETTDSYSFMFSLLREFWNKKFPL